MDHLEKELEGYKARAEAQLNALSETKEKAVRILEAWLLLKVDIELFGGTCNEKDHQGCSGGIFSDG